MSDTLIIPGVKRLNFRRCLSFFEAELNRAKEDYARNSVEKLKELEEEAPLTMSGREKAIFWMGINQGLSKANSILQVSKDTCKEE